LNKFIRFHVFSFSSGRIGLSDHFKQVGVSLLANHHLSLARFDSELSSEKLLAFEQQKQSLLVRYSKRHCHP
jgi:hypothetical protein